MSSQGSSGLPLLFKTSGLKYFHCSFNCSGVLRQYTRSRIHHILFKDPKILTDIHKLIFFLDLPKITQGPKDYKK